jgi:hypothetical protein
MYDNCRKFLMIFLLLTTLLGVLGCVTTSGPVSPASPGGIPQQDDPEFWRLWQDSRGLG